MTSAGEDWSNNDLVIATAGVAGAGGDGNNGSVVAADGIAGAGGGGNNDDLAMATDGGIAAME
jgi:hypothetical protein